MWQYDVTHNTEITTPSGENRATAIVNMHKKIKIGCVVPEICSRANTQTDRQTDTLITIFRSPNCGRSNAQNKRTVSRTESTKNNTELSSAPSPDHVTIGDDVQQRQQQHQLRGCGCGDGLVSVDCRTSQQSTALVTYPAIVHIRSHSASCESSDSSSTR